MELEGGLRQIREAADLERGRLSLACAPTLAATRLPLILAAFQKQYPSVTADISELASAEMLDSIRRQEVDFGIGARVANAAEFQFRPILVDPIYALVPVDLDPTPRESISVAELSRLPTLIVSGASALYSLLDEAQKAAGVRLDYRFEVRQVQTEIAMAAAGLGIAILPRIAVPATLDPKLRAVPIVDPPLSRELCVVTLRGQSMPPVATRFIELLERLIGDPARHVCMTAA
jgi:DNA-binding transcriptional LysR family regulator